ncbi:unnamed protein product [Protopolystoma xenopodis]|uniref:Uncharacterized protein n=1 Tax=Protopolystoma xenopodis TaxID=117903 RepID=A0A448WLV1_9PLAT|nr:unnamed protein product [Protopolystoma xenopodis]
MIRHHFGWSALQLVFLGFANQYGELATAINNEDILTLWMEELKYRLQHDFRPFFVFWGLPLVARSSSENNHDYTAMPNRIESGKSNTEQMLPGFLPVDLVTNLAPERLLRVAKQFGVDLDDTTKNTKNLSIPSDAPQLGSMGWRKKVASGVLSWWPCQDRDLSPHQAGFSRVSEIQVSTDDDNEDTKYEEEDEEEESHPQSNEKHSRMGLIQLTPFSYAKPSQASEISQKLTFIHRRDDSLAAFSCHSIHTERQHLTFLVVPSDRSPLTHHFSFLSCADKPDA